MSMENAIREAKRAAAKVLFAGTKVPPEIAAWRESVCRSGCRYFNAEHKECRSCGCFLDVKWPKKTHTSLSHMRIEETHCDQGKWNDIEIANRYRLIDGKKLLNHDQETV